MPSAEDIDAMTPTERERAMVQAMVDIQQVRIKAEALVENLKQFEIGFKKIPR